MKNKAAAIAFMFTLIISSILAFSQIANAKKKSPPSEQQALNKEIKENLEIDEFKLQSLP